MPFYYKLDISNKLVVNGKHQSYFRKVEVICNLKCKIDNKLFKL